LRKLEDFDGDVKTDRDHMGKGYPKGENLVNERYD
jgi:hypothetical protein